MKTILQSLILVLCLIFCSIADAATIVRYINTDSSTGGNGTTNDTTGANRAYASMSSWEQAEQADLVSDGDIHQVNISAPSGTVDTSSGGSVISGWTTGASNYIEMIGDRTNESVWDTNIYVRRRTNGSAHGALRIMENYVRIKNLQFEADLSGADSVIRFHADSGAVDYRLEKCYLRSYLTPTSIDNRCLHANGGDSGDTYVWNCIMDGGANAPIMAVIDGSFGGALHIRSSIFTRGNNGIWRNTGTVNAKNCIIFNTDDDIQYTVSPLDYCASDDNEGTNSIDISPGATEADDWNDAFTDYSNGDFTIKDTSSVLYNAGLDTSGESAPLDFTDDFIGTTRPQVSSWDVGAFELLISSFIPKIQIF